MALRPTAGGGAETLLAGASGAIWGVLTALVAWLLAHGSTLPPAAAAALFRRLMVLLVLNALVSFLPQISWEGHLGGGIAGLFTAGLLNVIRSGDRTRRTAATVVLLLMPVLFVVGLMVVMQSGRAWGGLRQRVAYGDRVTELLPPVVPERVAPVERSAVLLLVRAPRGYFRTAAARARVAVLRSAAARLEAELSGPTTGIEELDRRREQVKAYAAARGRELDLLGAMLAARALPDVPAWQAWGDAARESERRWAEIPKP